MTMHVSEFAHGTSAPESAKKPQTKVTLKSGHVLTCDFSASYLKFMRREGKKVLLKNSKGETVALDCKEIRSISSQPAQ